MPFVSLFVFAVEWYVLYWYERGTPATAVAASANLPRLSSARPLPNCAAYLMRVLVSASASALSKSAAAIVKRVAVEFGLPPVPSGFANGVPEHQPSPKKISVKPFTTYISPRCHLELGATEAS